jgi:sodium/potassium-transporting ATPase subunit beta
MANSGEEEKPTFFQNLSNGCSSFCHFLYNKDNGEVMGRSGRSWAKIGVFYIFFYGFLAAFFIAMLAAFMSTIERPEDGGAPKLTQFIENQPGLTRLDREFLLEKYSPSANTSDYAKALIKIFKGISSSSVYKGPCNETKPTLAPTVVPTGNNTNSTNSTTPTTPAPDTRPCFVPFSLYGECQPDPNDIDKSMFGLKEKKPCVFIKINKVFGWVPDVGSEFLNVICRGTGYIGHYPKGFLIEGFPFKGAKGHHLPFVAVQVDATLDVDVKCSLDERQDMKVSDSYNPTRSYGNILIEDIEAK